VFPLCSLQRGESMVSTLGRASLRGRQLMLLKIQRLDPLLAIPSYACEGDAGLDLYARESLVLAPNGGRATIPTGVSIALDPGFVGLIVPRSGIAANNGVTVLNAPGVVDSGYRGEIVVILVNHDKECEFPVRRGDRIAQLLITTVITVSPEDTAALPSSLRGFGALGHSGE
jgi:dUTP pyrophosphatase